MNKRGLVAVCAPRLGGRVAAEAAVEAIFDAIVRELVAGGHVVLTGFRTFEAVERRPRMGRNPFTGEPVAIPPRRVAVFRPAKMFRRFMVEPGLLPGDRSAAARRPATRRGAVAK